MERSASLEEAKKIMGKNFIGPEELSKISAPFKILIPLKNIPVIPFGGNFLRKIKKDYILILGIPGLTINKMREIIGFDPEKFEPCFYNQDWYLKEKFAAEEELGFKWYLISKNLNEESRGKDPEKIIKTLKKEKNFPSAVLAAFVFFTYYFIRGEILWKHDFIWCKDKDSNGDRIYVGRYSDLKKINKNGFNIHRRLSVRACYGFAPQLIK